GAQQCESLLATIQTKNFHIHVDEVVARDKISKFLLNYQNFTNAYIKVVPFKPNQEERLSQEDLYKALNEETPVYTKSIQLKDLQDYNFHGIELMLPKMDFGYYYIVVSSDSEFKKDNAGFTYTPFWVTNITYQNRIVGDVNEVLVSNRTTGKPIANAAVLITYDEYNNVLHKYVSKKVGTFKTAANGRFTYKEKLNYRTYKLKITSGKDVYEPSDGVYAGYKKRNNSKRTNTYLFTDRKIYRPGQSIYFKGIVVNADGKERSLMKDYSTMVYFTNANGQEVAQLAVKTNQFGSYEGEFKAPLGVLSGQMRIADYNSETSFRVEEYKRPKFNVEMQPIQGEFQVNDSITATGIAKAFAGNFIDGAEVNYRVVRAIQYNNWFYWWGWRPHIEPKEISNGKLTTGDDGSFDIVFKAIPDLESDPKKLPIFNYTIYADVTDVNGETHSTSTTVQVGYQSLVLGNNFSNEMNNESDFYIRLSTTNLNGQKIGAQGKLGILKLIVPDQSYFPRKWMNPDIKNWSKDEFNYLFPNDVYEDENISANWQIEKAVFQARFNSAESDSISIPDYKNWEPGYYKYESKGHDKNGVEVADIRYFTVYNPNKSTPSNNEVLWIKPLQKSAEPGETVTFLLSSMASDLIVNYETEANGALLESKSIKLSKEQKKLEFKIDESYRGNLTVQFSAVQNNHHFSKAFTIFVPYTNKQLDVRFATFRNKLLPGDAEEWILTVKNKKGGAEQAEFLATLYDASLDELFTPNSFYMNIYQTYYGTHNWNGPEGIGTSLVTNKNYYWNNHVSMPYRIFRDLNKFGWSNYYYRRYNRGSTVIMELADSANEIMEDSEETELALESVPGLYGEVDQKAKKDSYKSGEFANVSADMDTRQDESVMDEKEGGKNADLSTVKARSNFNETAFFYPQLTTNAKGEVQVKFTIPESLTKWRFLGLAHTQDLKIGTITEEVITQKELMVVPNAPRFLREGDEITIATKISNISENDLTGRVQLTLINPFTEEVIDSKFELANAQKSFTAEKGKSTVVSWTIKIPYTESTVKYKIVAQADDYSDGEENVLPILSNRMMVTESLPMPIRGNETKTFRFDKLLNAGKSKSLKHHQYTLEFTSNPAWYAIQAMPYMMEYPHECAEQTFTRYYSNAIATHIMNSNPKVKEVIDKWGQDSPDAFLSNLEKNQELKAVLLEETPWVLDAQNEGASKRNLSVLLDMNRMSNELEKALAKTIKTQSYNGGWPWFPGMKESRYITQHIVTGMGHLDHLGIKEIHEDRKVWNMIESAVRYLDKEIVQDYENAKKYDSDYLKNQHIGYNQVQYLYARSYFPDCKMDNSTKEAVDYYKDQAIKFWLTFNVYAEGMIALAAHRFEMKALATDIVQSLKDRSIQNEEFGMYWKDYQVGYYWYQAPVETQALMIEMFDEVTNDQSSVEELKIWLLKQKQTTNWKTTKQTTDAVYALLLKGTDLLASDEMVAITIGNKSIEYTDSPNEDNPYQLKAEAGTGYFKTAWNATQVKPEMGKISVSKKSAGVAWGAVYWQYFEDLDKITFAETNLKLKKELYVVEISQEGETLNSITDEKQLAVGDKVRVCIELRTDRNLEYVHMKDMRAAGFEPIDVLSRHRYQDGLGYYQSTKDVATHFFFDYIPKGTYVFEYDLRVQHAGDFSNGITTIQCMYAPEFTSHSEGVRLSVQE
ncbi:MG2 domain-containing protein, partial [Crocinitomix sp.]|nr:MG2 domain-containing protein [Crocinitomix sp.]